MTRQRAWFGGHLESLRRTMSRSFRSADAHTLEQVEVAWAAGRATTFAFIPQADGRHLGDREDEIAAHIRAGAP